MTWDTLNVLIISWAGKTAWKLVGKILNELEMYQVGKCWVRCPFPCDILAMYRLSTPPLAPSAWRPPSPNEPSGLLSPHLHSTLPPESGRHSKNGDNAQSSPNAPLSP